MQLKFSNKNRLKFKKQRKKSKKLKEKFNNFKNNLSTIVKSQDKIL